MRTKHLLAVLSSALCMTVLPCRALPGFSSGKAAQPEGTEWNNPENLALNKENPRAYFFSFADAASARRVLPEHSAYWRSLNGDWKFHWAPDPESRPKDFFKPEYNADQWDNIAVPSSWNIVGVQKDGSLKYGVPIYVNQPVIFQHDRRVVGDWKGGVMRTPPSNWTTYKHRNEVGSYRRTFDVPADWNGREVFISFDGVDSFFYLWINGKYVGFSKNSRNAATFDVTPYINKGENTVAVEVYRNSDGSWLEAQDMFRLPGIFRTVAIYSTPKVFVRDFNAIPDLDAQYKDGVLNLKAEVSNRSAKTAKGLSIDYTLYAHALYSDDNTPVAGVAARAAVPAVEAGELVKAQAQMEVKNPKLWSAEAPYRYTVVAELKDAKGKVLETVSTTVGFRKVEVKNVSADKDEFGLAGRYFLVNGKPVKTKGVNRHETSPERGHAITRDQMETEVMLMKRANINHIRNSHYPTDPYMYFLADKYGLYLEDEANIESHEYYYGEQSLSHPEEWKNAHVARVLEMVRSTINRPSIVIWSLGNEAGPGKNFVAAYDALKAVDTTRPVQYERNNSIVDIGSNQYPSIGWMRGAVKGTYDIKYPFHVSEYAHSMGQACGNLDDYWEAIESTNFFIGGAIWDWVDQAMFNYTPDGKKYFAYGGDFGDTPNDGQFVMNGIVFADLTPKPQYWEVKKVYQNIGIKAIDAAKGTFEVFNKNYFTDLSGYMLVYGLYEDGKEVQGGVVQLPDVAPRSRVVFTQPETTMLLTAKRDASGKMGPATDPLLPDKEYFVKFQLVQKEATPWADKGYVQADEQILIQSASERPAVNAGLSTACGQFKVDAPRDGNFITLSGEGFAVTFDKKEGTIYSLAYDGRNVISEGNGPRLEALRAFTNNDNWFYEPWFANGLHNLRHTVKSMVFTTCFKDGTAVLSFAVESEAPNAAVIKGGTSSGKNSIEELTGQPTGFKFTSQLVWTVYPNGSIELQANVSSNNPSLTLPRLGYMVRVPRSLDNFTYYGRGPEDNYPDRQSSQFVGLYQRKVKDMFVAWPKPQDTGNRDEVRWCALTSDAGNGVVFVATDGTMSASALPYSALDMTLAGHPHQLPAAGDTYLHLDVGTTGLGGNSCGQGGPLNEDRIKATDHSFGFIIRPAGREELSKTASVSGAGTKALVVKRSRVGVVEIDAPYAGAEIQYTINNGKPQKYTAPFNLRDGGVVSAWDTKVGAIKKGFDLKTTAAFEKIDAVATTVVFASSEEAQYAPASNLVDGDPSTIWHTMYSVTVSKYPHWVDLDAGEVKNLTGIRYLPRQNSRSGNVKEYQVQVSTDGTHWGDPVAKGAFENTLREKEVKFSTPVKGRYVRFTALSSQDNQDFASGAELTVLAQ